MKRIKTFKSIVRNTEFLVNFLADSLYSSYWARADRENDDVKYSDATSIEEVWANDLMNGKNIIIEDVEEEVKYAVSLNDVEKGLKVLAFNFPKNYANIMTENGDFYDYDAFLQCVVFKDVIYG